MLPSHGLREQGLKANAPGVDLADSVGGHGVSSPEIGMLSNPVMGKALCVGKDVEGLFDGAAIERTIKQNN
jgi:hypothetical protein